MLRRLTGVVFSTYLRLLFIATDFPTFAAAAAAAAIEMGQNEIVKYLFRKGSKRQRERNVSDSFPYIYFFTAVALAFRSFCFVRVVVI